MISTDLETTGLRPARERIVQIGVITIGESAWHFDMLVTPNVPITADSTAIQGFRA